MNKKDLEKLKNEWKERLKKDGFISIENENDERFYTKSITPEAQESIKNNDHLILNDVYNQLTAFYYNTNFTKIYEKNLRKTDRKVLAPNDLSQQDLKKECGKRLETIFLQYISGESMSQIARNHNITRMQIYPIFNSIIKFAMVRSKSIKAESRLFLKNFNQGFGKKGRNGRKAKLKLEVCLHCNRQYFDKDKEAYYDYCGNCITKTEFTRGNKKQIAYKLITGENFNLKRK